MTRAVQTRRKLVGAALAGFVILLTAVVLIGWSRVASGSKPAMPVVVKIGPVITEAKALLHPTRCQLADGKCGSTTLGDQQPLA
jgi:hypothetical protein